MIFKKLNGKIYACYLRIFYLFKNLITFFQNLKIFDLSNTIVYINLYLI